MRCEDEKCLPFIFVGTCCALNILFSFFVLNVEVFCIFCFLIWFDLIWIIFSVRVVRLKSAPIPWRRSIWTRRCKAPSTANRTRNCGRPLEERTKSLPYGACKCLMKSLHCPAVFGHFSPAPVKGGTNPINQSSQNWLFVNQSINRPKGLQWQSTLDWLIQFTVGKIVPRGWFPGGSKKWPNTAGQYSTF